jgi:hypothetical protein
MQKLKIINKKRNTILLIAASTVLGVALCIIFFIALMSLYLFLITPLILAAEGYGGIAAPFTILVLLISLGLSYLVFRIILKAFLHKYNPEKYFLSLEKHG